MAVPTIHRGGYPVQIIQKEHATHKFQIIMALPQNWNNYKEMTKE